MARLLRRRRGALPRPARPPISTACRASGTGLLAGGVKDEVVPPGAPGRRPLRLHPPLHEPGRHVQLRRVGLSQDRQRGLPALRLRDGRRIPRRDPGGRGRRPELRLRAAGWEVEQRERASVVHHNRQTVAAFCRRSSATGRVAPGSNREYPGAAPPQRRRAWSGGRAPRRQGAAVGGALARAATAPCGRSLDPVELIAHEFGRSLPNERPLSVTALWHHIPPLRERPGANGCATPARVSAPS